MRSLSIIAALFVTLPAGCSLVLDFNSRKPTAAAPGDASASGPESGAIQDSGGGRKPESGWTPEAGPNADAGAGVTFGLVGYWKFDEGSGSTAVDSINSHNGRVTASWTTSAFPSQFANPFALDFNGVS